MKILTTKENAKYLANCGYTKPEIEFENGSLADATYFSAPSWYLCYEVEDEDVEFLVDYFNELGLNFWLEV